MAKAGELVPMARQQRVQASHAGHKQPTVKLPAVKSQRVVNARAAARKAMAIAPTMPAATELIMANQHHVAAKTANKRIRSAVATSSAATLLHVQLNQQVLRFN